MLGSLGRARHLETELYELSFLVLVLFVLKIALVLRVAMV